MYWEVSYLDKVLAVTTIELGLETIVLLLLLLFHLMWVVRRGILWPIGGLFTLVFSRYYVSFIDTSTETGSILFLVFALSYIFEIIYTLREGRW